MTNKTHRTRYLKGFLYLSLINIALSGPVWVIGGSFKIKPDGSLWNSKYEAEQSNYREKNRIWNNIDRTVHISGAKGETVSFQIVIDSENSADIKINKLVNLDNGFTTVDNIQIFNEHFLKVTSPSTFSNGNQAEASLGKGYYPDALIPLYAKKPFNDDTDLQVFWVDIRIPTDLEGNNYTGLIQVGEDNVKPIKLDLRVFNFNLPDKKSLQVYWQFFPTNFWRLNDLPETWYGSTVSWNLLYKYYKTAAEHGASLVYRGIRPTAKFNYETGELLFVDWTKYALAIAPILNGEIYNNKHQTPAFVEAPLREGFPNADLFTGKKHGKAHQRAVKEYAREIYRFFSQMNWQDKLISYYIDEPNSVEQYNDHVEYSKIINEATNGGIKYLITEQPVTPDPYRWYSRSFNKKFPKLDNESIDIWAMVANLYFPEDLENIKAGGAETWVYQWDEPYIGGQFIDADALSMRTWAWIGWKYNIDGLLYWAVNFWNEDPYTDPVTQGNLNGDGTLFYPGKQVDIYEPVTSIRMKAFYRGIQDFEYFSTLKNLNPEHALLNDINKIMRSALGSGSKEKGYTALTGPGNWSRNPDEWDNLIFEIGIAIESELNKL